MGAWWIESHHAAFDPRQVNERENTAVVERQVIGDRFRFTMKCPRCPNKPVIRGEKLDAELEHLYVQGARAAVHRMLL